LCFISEVEKGGEASDVDSWIDDGAGDGEGFLEFEESRTENENVDLSIARVQSALG